ncbi:MAG: hypothetical protein WBB45_09595 [Cyclobacteriaceae bacterium]
MKKKMNLASLQVKSFKTTEEKAFVKGGKPESWYTNCPVGWCESVNYRYCEVDY